MQRTVGPCHRDRKQKRNEKSEEKRDTTAGEGGRKGSHRVGQWGCLQVTPLVGQPGQEDIRQQMLLVGVGCMERAGHLALGRGRKGESAKATASAQRTGRGGGGGERGTTQKGRVPEQARSGHRNIQNQGKCLCTQVLGTSVNAGKSQALCHLELGSRKAGGDGSRNLPAIACCTPPCVPARRSFGPVF